MNRHKSRDKKAEDKPKVFLDANIWLSAIFWPEGKASQAVNKAWLNYRVFTSDYVIAEVSRKAKERFPHQGWRVEQFFQRSKYNLTILDTPEETVAEELLVRDNGDRPIVRAAIREGVDIILSGDRDLLEAGLVYPAVFTVHDFLENNPSGKDT